MDTAEKIRQIRKSTGMNRKEFCEYFDIPYRTVSEWERDGRHAPEYVVRLLAYYVGINRIGKEHGSVKEGKFRKDTDREMKLSFPEGMESFGNMDPQEIAEPSFSYGTDAKKEYTIEDYFALPDDRRAELIDGQFYDMATPAIIHQAVIGKLHLRFEECRKKMDKPCRLLFSPVGVQLDCDNKTVVEPDLLIVCDGKKVQERVVYGAPDLVVEVLSPSTRKKDMNLKLFKYSNAGVREYWMIDTKNSKVIVHDLENDAVPSIYGLDAKVPVGISGGRCSIDFGDIMKEIEEESAAG